MFGGSLFGNDPFFSMHQQQMANMNQMMQNPFGAMGMDLMPPPFGQPAGPSMLSLTNGLENQRNHPRHPDPTSRDIVAQNPMMSPFGFGGMAGMGGMFQNMNSMMSNMQQSMTDTRGDPNAHFMSQSTMTSYSNNGPGPPKVYQATSSTRQAPGGIRETRKSVRDSEAAIEKLSVGRYMADRGHVEERQRNTRSGDVEENQEYLNIDEEDLAEFDNDWRTKACGPDRRSRLEHPHGNTRAITNGPTQAITNGPTQAITNGPTQAITNGPIQAITNDQTQPITNGQNRYDHVRPDQDHGAQRHARPHRDHHHQTSQPYARSQPHASQHQTHRDRNNPRHTETHTGTHPAMPQYRDREHH